MSSVFIDGILKERVAFITGGGTGITGGVARALADAGANVALVSRSIEHLEPAAKAINDVRASREMQTRTSALPATGEAFAVAANVRKPDEVEKAISATVERFGKIDIVVNGAAGNFLVKAEDLSPNGFGTVVDIDLKGTFNVCRAAFDQLKTNRGQILNISATLHYLGTPMQLHVSAAKAGVDALTRNLAVEWGRYGIRVNAIAPGPIEDTEGMKRLVPEPIKVKLRERVPLGRFGLIKDIEQAAVFLCSDAASYINGAILVVDGGHWVGGKPPRLSSFPVTYSIYLVAHGIKRDCYAMLNLTPATFEEFHAEAQRGNVVPVVRTVLADLQTPVGAFLRIAGDASHAFLLESIEGGERIARYSFLGANPWMVARARDGQTIIERNGQREVLDQSGFDFLREHFGDKNLAPRPNLAPLSGGAVGYVAYDAARWFEPILENGKHKSAVDDAAWMFFRNIVAFDRVRQQMEITSVVFVGEANADVRLRELYDDAVAETAEIERQLNRELPPDDRGSKRCETTRDVESNWVREDFEAAVDRVKDYIAAGDCYQGVIAQQFSKPTCASPLAIYRALRATNPSPYMYFLRMGDETIIGASPEMLVRCSNQALEYRPIAGTRRRGETEADDVRLGEEMRNDEKEVAEHVMLVDLGRNDLGRVSEYGSVRVEQLMFIERYSQVQHLVSSLHSKLRDDLDRFDALAACFPAGTVTGAPKIRAMQIIDELEPSPRGVYAGAVLYVDYAANLDSCIAIRTIELRDGVATVEAGAGIVADSVPAQEYQECVNKARAMFRAIELAEKGL